MAKKPLYPHVTPSQRTKESNATGDIFVYKPTASYSGGIVLIFARNLSKANSILRAQPSWGYFNYEYQGTLDELGEKVRREGVIEWTYGS